MPETIENIITPTKEIESEPQQEAEPQSEEKKSSAIRKKVEKLARMLMLSTTLSMGPDIVAQIADKERGLHQMQEDALSKLSDKEKAMELMPNWAGFIFENIEYIKNKPYLKDLIYYACQHTPAVVLRHFQKIQDMPFSDEALRMATAELLGDSYGVGIVFEYAHLLSGKPYAQEILTKAAGKNPVETIGSFDKWKNVSTEPDEILQIAVRENIARQPYVNLDYVDTLSHLENFRDIIEKSVRECEQPSIHRFMGLKKYFGEDWVKNLFLETLAKDNYGNVFSFANILMEVPWGRDLLRERAVKGPAEVIIYFNDLRPLENSREILKNAVSKTMDKDSGTILLYFKEIEKYLDNPEEVLKNSAQKCAASGSAHTVLMQAGMFKDKSWALETIKEAAQRDPTEAMRNYERFKDISGAEDIIRGAAYRTIETGTQTAVVFYSAKKIQSKPWFLDVIDRAAKQDPRNAVALGHEYIEISGTNTIFREAAQKLIYEEPNVVAENLLKSQEHLKGLPWFNEMLSGAARADTLNSYMYYHYGSGSYISSYPDTPIDQDEIRSIDKTKKIFKDADPQLAKIFEQIYKEAGIYKEGRVRVFDWADNVKLFIPGILAGEIEIQDCFDLAANEQKFFDAMIDKISDPIYANNTGFKAMLRNKALRFVSEINGRHEMTDNERFALVEQFDAKKLYWIIINGEEELFTSSFNGLFDRLVKKMASESISGDKLLSQIGHANFRIFIKLCASYNRLNDFLSTMDKEAAIELMNDFIGGLEKEKKPVEQAVAIVDTISAIDDSSMIAKVTEKLKNEHQAASLRNDTTTKNLYSLMASILSTKSQDAWLKELHEKYPLPDLSEIRSAELFNRNGVNIQQHFFYDDKDGHASFANFAATYRKAAGWHFEDMESYIRISSATDGKRVIIYANKPASSTEGTKNISELIKKEKIDTIVIVHRGHSYHAMDTIRQIPPSAKIVSLGSCGGYRNIMSVLEKASQAHIITTKGTGTMTVNDPLLKMINDRIKLGQDVVWQDVWNKAQGYFKGNSMFQNYIAPNKNLGLLFLKAYEDLQRRDKAADKK